MSTAGIRVEKATSSLLNGPDWAMNMDICDFINYDYRQAKDVIKTVKKRLQNKNPKVQLLALTLLETIIKNCGDYVHHQVVERNILQEMIKIVRKKSDMHVRNKILELLDSWQEAFGGSVGKYPQYYWAYDELRRSGLEFPQRSADSAPIFTPPLTQPAEIHSQAGYGMPSYGARRTDEAMTSELSLSDLDSIQSVMGLLNDVIEAVNPNDHEAVKDELIVDLVSHCRSNHKKVMQLVNSTRDEEILGRGLELNDSLQRLLAKHDMIASGSLPSEAHSTSPRPNAADPATASSLPTELESTPRENTPKTPTTITSDQIEEEEEEEDDFVQLVHRRSKPRPVPSQGTSDATGDQVTSLKRIGAATTAATGATTPSISTSSALSLPDQATPVQTTMTRQDMIDLLSTNLSRNSLSPGTPLTPPSSSDQVGQHQASVSLDTQGYPYDLQIPPVTITSTSNHIGQHPAPVSLDTQGRPYNLQTSPFTTNQIDQQHAPVSLDTQDHPYGLQISPVTISPASNQIGQHQVTILHFPQGFPCDPQTYPVKQGQVPYNIDTAAWPQPHVQGLLPQHSSHHSSPAWAATANSDYIYGPPSSAPYPNQTHLNSSPNSSFPIHAFSPSQHYNPFDSSGTDTTTPILGEAQTGSNQRPVGPTPNFVPSYRLFEDLVDLGNMGGGFKASGTSLSGTSVTSTHDMGGGQK